MTASKPAPEPHFFLDSSAIVHGANLPAAECATTPSVVAEFRPGGATRRRLDLLLAAGLRVVEPRPASLARVDEAASLAGSLGRLSVADREILALSLDGGATARLVTDDYTLQDVARRLGVATLAVATRGVEATLDWAARCAGCGRWYDAETAGRPCPVCGSDVRRRPRRVR